MYTNVDQIREAFINAGWDKSIEFAECSINDADGVSSIIDDIRRGKVYFRNIVTGNIYDASGKLVLFNLKANIRQVKG